MRLLKGMTVFFIIIFVMMSFGCETSLDLEENAFEDYQADTKESSSMNRIAIESKVVDGPESMQFVYTGEPIVFDYQFDSDGECDMGLMIFVDGIIQEFSVNGNDEAVVLYKTSLNANEIVRFTVSFEPSVGKEGDEVQLIFANISNPNIISITDSINTFGNNHNIFQPMPWSIKMEKGVTDTSVSFKEVFLKERFSKKELDSFVHIEEDGTRINQLDQAMVFNFEETGAENGITIDLKKEEDLELYLYGNFPGKYRVCLLGDFQLVPMNGLDYIDVTVEKKSKYSLRLNLKSNDLSSYENVFAVAVPLDNDQGLLKSKSLYVKE